MIPMIRTAILPSMHLSVAATAAVWGLSAVLVADEVSPAAASTAATVPADTAPTELDRTQFPLDWIEDRTELQGTADVGAYYSLLDYARRVDPAALRAAAAAWVDQRWRQSRFRDWPVGDFPLFYDLVEHPEAYRGRPVTLHGHIRLHRVRHEENEFGLDPIHEAYLYTDDSQSHPATIIFTANPDGIPVGEETVNGITATGYFLKLYNYPARDGKIRYSPLILARDLRWTPTQTGLSTGAQVTIITVFLLAVALITTLVFINTRRDAAARQRERALLGEDRPPDFSALDQTSPPAT
jgi:hypothetical protein